MAVEATLAAPAQAGLQSDVNAAEEKQQRLGKYVPKPPDDFESEAEFIAYVRETYDKDAEADQVNRDEGVLDARFMAGDQWDAAVKQRRAASSKPTLTINRLPAYVAQLVGNRRLNDTGIKIIPDTGGVRRVAEVREGLIRNIQKESKAQQAYDRAFENAVIRGLGNFKIDLDYAHDDVFEQDIRISTIPNPDAIVWDRESIEPTGADAEHVFVVDTIGRKRFKDRYPEAKAGEWNSGLNNSAGWDTSDTVQIVSFWRVRTRLREVAMFTDGSVNDVTDLPVAQWADKVATRKDGTPMVREVHRRYAQMYLCSSQDILAGPYELPIQRVPVFRVPGWEMFIEGDRIRWGLIRFLRDPQKLHNYWRSTLAELLVSTPKAKWLASNAAVEGREEQWRKSHLSDDPLLIWNGESGAPPQRQPPVQMEPALIEQAGVAAQDIRDVSNIHEANLGQQSNEVSGKAIMARQRVGEVGSVIYQDNLNSAIEEAGRVINQLIPFVYDTPRTVKILGPDMLTEEQVKLGDPEVDPESVDITLGKYSVTVTTGPSYATRRVEAREEMMAMVNSMPEQMAVAADKIIEAQDWPGADKIAARIRRTLPPGVIGEEDMKPEELQARQEQAEQKGQMQDAHMQLEMAEKQAQIAKTQAEAQLKVAQARLAEAKAQEAETAAAKNLAEIETDAARVTIEAADKLDPPKPASGAKKNDSKQ